MTPELGLKIIGFGFIAFLMYLWICAMFVRPLCNLLKRRREALEAQTSEVLGDDPTASRGSDVLGRRG